MEQQNVDSTSLENEVLYTLYMHTCIHNGKKYIGVTDKDAKNRWNNGSGYKTNFELYTDIAKYGWDEGFKHEILSDNLTWEEVKEAEKSFIRVFETTNPDKGYNHKSGGVGYGQHKKRENYGEKIKALRINKKINQDELALILGVTRGAISNYEGNKRTPSLAELKKIAEYFGVGLDYFGTASSDASFEISSRIIEYFKSNNRTLEAKTELFNDIMIAYTKYVLQAN